MSDQHSHSRERGDRKEGYRCTADSEERHKKKKMHQTEEGAIEVIGESFFFIFFYTVGMNRHPKCVQICCHVDTTDHCQ